MCHWNILLLTIVPLGRHIHFVLEILTLQSRKQNYQVFPNAAAHHRTEQLVRKILLVLRNNTALSFIYFFYFLSFFSTCLLPFCFQLFQFIGCILIILITNFIMHEENIFKSIDIFDVSLWRVGIPRTFYLSLSSTPYILHISHCGNQIYLCLAHLIPTHTPNRLHQDKWFSTLT